MEKRTCNVILLIFLVVSFCLSGIAFPRMNYHSFEGRTSGEYAITSGENPGHMQDTAAKEVSGSNEWDFMSNDEESCEQEDFQLSAFLLLLTASLYMITLFQRKRYGTGTNCGHISHLRVISYIQKKDGRKRS